MDLTTIELFKDFTPEEIERFIPAIHKIALKKGDALFEEGDPGDALFIIYEGAIRIFKMIDKKTGDEKSLALLEAGTYLGEMTIMDGTPRSASARADSDAVVLKITRADFIRLMRSYPQGIIRLFSSFLNVISNRLRSTNNELVVLYKVGKIISLSQPLDEMLSEIMNVLLNFVNVKLGMVFLINEYTDKLEAREAIGEDSDALKNLKFGKNESVVGTAISKNKLLNIEDFENSELYRGINMFGFEKNNMIVAPLARRAKAFGAILLAERLDGKPFSTANANLVDAVTSQVSAAIESALFQKDHAAREHFDQVRIQY